MILIGLLVVFSILAWYSLIRPLSYFSRIGVKQTTPWPIVGDHWRIIVRQMTTSELLCWIYNLHKKTRYLNLISSMYSSMILNNGNCIKQTEKVNP